MNKKYVFWLIGVLLSNIIFAQNELIITVTTDKYADETSWKLFDTNKNLVAERNNFADTTIYYDTVVLNANLCYYWTIYDAYGDGLSSYGYPGDYSLTFNGNQITQCQNPNFGDSISVYGIGNNCASIDAALNKILLADSLSYSGFQVPVEVFNFGSNIISSITGWYKIDNGAEIAFDINNLAIEFGTSATIVLPDTVQILNSGAHTLSIKMTSINQLPDEDLFNNERSKVIIINNGYWQKPMHEIFTANWCTPCALANPLIDAVFNNHPQSYSLIKYQYYDDQYFMANGGNMASFYGVNGIPAMYVNGEYAYPGEYTDADLEANNKLLSKLNLIVEPQAIGDSVFAKLTVQSQEDIPEDIYARIAVVEKKTIGNVGSNGEQEFHNVFMRFLSTWQGDNLGTLSAQHDLVYETKGTMSFTNVEEMTDLSLIVYLFHKNDYRVIQSEMKDIPYAPAPPNITFNIQNGATNVDTLATVEIISNKALFNTDGSEITNFNEIIRFTQGNENPQNVAFQANITEDYKTITVTPNNLTSGQVYHLSLVNVISVDGVAVENANLTFTTANALNIYQDAADNMAVYPNPVKEKLLVTVFEKGYLRLVNLDGVVLFKSEIDKTGVIDFSELENGVYVLQYQSEFNSITKRILKN